MSPAHRRYLLVDQGVGAAVFNFALNAGIAWALNRHADVVPLWGQQSIAGDTLVTSFVLPFLTCLIVTALVRAEVARGRLGTIELPTAFRRLPARAWRRGAIFGIATVAALGVPAVAALAAFDLDGMTLGRFVLFKAAFAALAAVVVTPPIALYALAGAAAPSSLTRDSAA